MEQGPNQNLSPDEQKAKSVLDFMEPFNDKRMSPRQLLAFVQAVALAQQNSTWTIDRLVDISNNSDYVAWREFLATAAAVQRHYQDKRRRRTGSTPPDGDPVTFMCAGCKEWKIEVPRVSNHAYRLCHTCAKIPIKDVMLLPCDMCPDKIERHTAEEGIRLCRIHGSKKNRVAWLLKNKRVEPLPHGPSAAQQTHMARGPVHGTFGQLVPQQIPAPQAQHYGDPPQPYSGALFPRQTTQALASQHGHVATHLPPYSTMQQSPFQPPPNVVGNLDMYATPAPIQGSLQNQQSPIGGQPQMLPYGGTTHPHPYTYNTGQQLNTAPQQQFYSRTTSGGARPLSMHGGAGAGYQAAHLEQVPRTRGCNSCGASLLPNATMCTKCYSMQ